MSDSSPGKAKPKSKTLILGAASGLAALALAILAGWLIVKRVGEPEIASLPKDSGGVVTTAPSSAGSEATDTEAKAQPEVMTQTEEAQAPAAQSGGGEVAAVAPAENATSTAPEAPASDAAASSETKPAPSTPAATEPSGETKIELARVEPSGDAVFAGKSGPDAKVELFAGNRKIGESSSDAQGNWAVVLDKQLPAGSSDIYAVVTDKAGKMSRSNESIAVVIDESKTAQPLIVSQSDAGSRVIQNPAKQEQPAAAQQESAAPAAPAQPVEVATATAPDAAAPAALVVTGEPQTTAATATEAATATPSVEAPVSAPSAQPSSSPVSIEAADYDASGRLTVSGRSAPGTAIRLYYDNQYVGDTLAGGDGYWSLSLDRPLDDAVHAVRADALAPGGAQVAGRAEVTFIAALPEAEQQKLAVVTPDATAAAPIQDQQQTAAPAASSAPVSDEPTAAPVQTATAESAAETAARPENPNRITVARGDNLWRLARDLYGRGIRYTTIYDANRDQIRNPDLIFPGQVFLLPRVSDSGDTKTN